jgi:hypothetical protein
MKNIFIVISVFCFLLLAITVFAADKIVIKDEDLKNADVEVESEDADIAGANDSIDLKNPDAQNGDRVEQSEDVEEFKGNVDDLNKDNKVAAAPEDGEVAPPSDDPHADEKYQQTLQDCETKAEDSGDFNASLRKCMEDHGFAQDLNDAENNVF